MVSSLQVAEKFGKLHKNVLGTIRGIDMSEQFTGLHFKLSEYRDSTGRSLPMYWMTRDGFWALAMTFAGKEAATARHRHTIRGVWRRM